MLDQFHFERAELYCVSCFYVTLHKLYRVSFFYICLLNKLRKKIVQISCSSKFLLFMWEVWLGYTLQNRFRPWYVVATEIVREFRALDNLFPIIINSSHLQLISLGAQKLIGWVWYHSKNRHWSHLHQCGRGELEQVALSLFSQR